MRWTNLSWLLLSLLSVGINADSFTQIILDNKQLELHVTPAVGGRVIGFNLKGKENFINVGSPYIQHVQPRVTATANNISYLGHIVWIGPQSQWWRKQQLNLQRYQASAVWPPDPYIIYADNKITRQNSTELDLEGIKSPISGMQINKRFSLDPANPNQVRLIATGENISQQNQAWDLWFNTRVDIGTQVIVPAAQQDIRLTSFENEHTGPITYEYRNHYLILDSARFDRQKSANQGKLFIQPQQGWMAGYRHGQLFIVQFPLVAKGNIHPDQAQVELYASYVEEDMQQSLIEMELHSPFMNLAPGDTNQIEANWYLFAYPVDFTQGQILALLNDKVTQLDQ
ncbi:DUF4380 domain-containing protein [Neptunicella sp.]|uniref:DUF4380 domain-containing protein n=1 Tax=Neptunicella sp. TaxID=2125986 RepID=UPI003F691CB4